jgi:hypothetical protein
LFWQFSFSGIVASKAGIRVESKHLTLDPAAGRVKDFAAVSVLQTVLQLHKLRC